MINLAYASLSSRLKDLLGPVTRVKKKREQSHMYQKDIVPFIADSRVPPWGTWGTSPIRKRPPPQDRRRTIGTSLLYGP
jgi:hypothetical protein